MKISIITVCLNSGRTIRRALQSIQRQTYRPIEVLVVDGKSSDDTLTVVREFQQILGSVVSEKDEGIYYAMNKGVALASGDLVFFLNSDDAFYDSEVLADVAERFSNEPSLDLLFGNAIIVRPEGWTLRTFRHINQSTLPLEDLCHQTVFARRSLFDRIGLFDTRFHINADYDWLIRVFRSDARCAWFNRRIAFFALGGYCTLDPVALEVERRQVRLQYMSPLALDVALFQRRLLHWLHAHFGAHPLGYAPLTDKDEKYFGSMFS